MEVLGTAQAAAAVAAAQAQAEAADRQARAAEQVAAAQSEAVKMQARAALAEAVGKLDDEGLIRFKEQEARDADRKSTYELLDKIGAAVACIENGGKPTDTINRRAYDGSDDVSDANGVAQAVNWHNVVAAQQMLVEAREKIAAISLWSAPTSRESVLERVEGYLSEAKRLRPELARDVVSTIRKTRTIFQGSGVLLLALCSACVIVSVLAPENDYWLGAIFLGLLGAVLVLLSATAPKSKAPISFDDMLKEAAGGSFPTATVWAAIAGVGGTIVVLGLVAGFWMKSTTSDPRKLAAGTWYRDGHRLVVNASSLRLDDGTQNLALRPPMVRMSNTVANFDDALLHEGIISDDHCSGSVEVSGNTLVVTASGHSDCAGFAGIWSRQTAPAVQQGAVTPQAQEARLSEQRRELERLEALQREALAAATAAAAVGQTAAQAPDRGSGHRSHSRSHRRATPQSGSASGHTNTGDLDL